MRLTILLLFASLSMSSALRAEPKLRVFILAGQSNMEGQGVVDLHHPKYYNGGKGTLEWHMKKPEKAKRYAHLRRKDGTWVQRDDVWVRFRTKNELKKGPLSIGFAGYSGKHHIGPELQFGHVVGDALKDNVLLIKTAWGGKSLHKDFRPPSAGGETGPYYKKMIAEVREGLDQLAKDFPKLGKSDVEIAGFVWFQGWNDMFNEGARADYAKNLAHLIRDVRKEFGTPTLPVVVGELGNGGEKASPNMKAIRKAQADVAELKEWRGSVRFAKTTSFARPREESPNVGHGHHWFGNAESYFLVGDALGKQMVSLIASTKAR
ncbi:MAG: sialate O-acetylesterase [Planctomycetota bacterium]